MSVFMCESLCFGTFILLICSIYIFRIVIY